MEASSTVSWNAFEDCVSSTFRNLIIDTDFTDVTLVCDDDKQIDAHKVILSSASNFFKRVLVRNPHRKPMLYLKGLRYDEVKSVIEFIYLGQTEVNAKKIRRFIAIALDLEIKGIDENMLEIDQQYDQVDKDTTTLNSGCGALNHNILHQVMTTESCILPQTEHDNKSLESGTDDNNKTINSTDHCQQSTNDIENEKKGAGLGVKIPESKVSVNAFKSMYKKSGSFPCSSCEKSFFHLSVLQRHNKIIHEGIRFPCNMCDYKATQRNSLKRHFQSKHSL